MLKEGDKAPSFSTEDEKGNIVSSKALKGQKYIVFFYPRDNTPGCTKQACTIRDNYSALKKLKVHIFGVSKDSASSHKKFIDKFNLPFPLLMDEGGELIKSFGAWGEKSMYGRKYMGIIRSTFVINKKGVVEKVFPKVNVSEHATELLDYLRG
jgi:peroxiredoxin Q/BCP